MGWMTYLLSGADSRAGVEEELANKQRSAHDDLTGAVNTSTGRIYSSSVGTVPPYTMYGTPSYSGALGTWTVTNPRVPTASLSYLLASCEVWLYGESIIVKYENCWHDIHGNEIFIDTTVSMTRLGTMLDVLEKLNGKAKK